MTKLLNLFVRNRTPIMIFGFLGVAYLVNGMYVAFTQKIAPELVEKEYYQKGERYQDTLEEMQRFDRRQWRINLRQVEEGFEMSFLNSQGHPLQNSLADIYFQNAQSKRNDLNFSSIPTGKVLEFSQPQKGIYFLKVVIRDQENTVYRHEATHRF